MWDVSSSTLVAEYEAHSKRVWSLDYCNAAAGDPSLLASASDDCTVKLWSTKSPNSVAQVSEARCAACRCAVEHAPTLHSRVLWHASVPLTGLHRSLAGCSECGCPESASWQCGGSTLRRARKSCSMTSRNVNGYQHALRGGWACLQIDMKANVCAVKWRPGSEHELAVGSADHSVYIFDVRATAQPLSFFAGHR